MADSFKWNGAAAMKQIVELAGKRIDAAGRVLKNGVVRSLSRSQRTRGKGARRRGLDPSKPGEYPKLVTHNLRRSVVWEFDKRLVTGRFGTNLKYGKYLQMGTRARSGSGMGRNSRSSIWRQMGVGGMQARPWLTLGVQDNARVMKRVIETGTVGDTGGVGGGTAGSGEAGGGG